MFMHHVSLCWHIFLHHVSLCWHMCTHIQITASPLSIRRNHRTIYAKSRVVSSILPLKVFGNIKTFTVEFDIPYAEICVQMEVRGNHRYGWTLFLLHFFPMSSSSPCFSLLSSSSSSSSLFTQGLAPSPSPCPGLLPSLLSLLPPHPVSLSPVPPIASLISSSFLFPPLHLLILHDK